MNDKIYDSERLGELLGDDKENIVTDVQNWPIPTHTELRVEYNPSARDAKLHYQAILDDVNENPKVVSGYLGAQPNGKMDISQNIALTERNISLPDDIMKDLDLLGITSSEVFQDVVIAKEETEKKKRIFTEELKRQRNNPHNSLQNKNLDK